MTRGIRTWTAAGLTAGLVAAAVLATAPAQAASGHVYYVPVSRSLVVAGHGYGHGHGMSQYGAEGAAREGKSYRQIVRFYYPGTTWGTNRDLVRVLVTGDYTSGLQVRATAGLTLRDLQSRALSTLPARSGRDSWRLKPGARDRSVTVAQFHDAKGWHTWRRLLGDGQFEAGGPLALVLPSGATTSYRGVLRAASPYAGATVRDTVNVLPMDAYLRGVVAQEMPASWHTQALRAQAVAARTYASYEQRLNRHRYYQLCDTTACQVYGGASAETSTTDLAVAKTAGRVLLYGGHPAFTQFSSSSGGWTSYGGQPYLPAQRDPYDDWSGNGVHDWTTPISVTRLESTFPQLGTLDDIRVVARDGHGAWGGRVNQVVLDGSDSAVALTGEDLRFMFGLRSTWFTFEPTPIITKWRQLGGAKSPLGRPTSPEVPVAGAGRTTGARQLFDNGRAFWTRADGATALSGAVLARYRKDGGPGSRFGFPRTSVLRTSEGHGRKTGLDHGMILWSAPTGAHSLYGRVLIAYRKHHLSGGRLGYPLTSVAATDTTESAHFQGGTVVLDKRTGKLTITYR